MLDLLHVHLIKKTFREGLQNETWELIGGALCLSPRKQLGQIIFTSN